MKSRAGFTLIEVLAAMIIGGVALVAFTQTVKPTVSSNKASRKHIDVTGSLAEVLDSVMVLGVTNLDGMNGKVSTSRQGVKVRLNVAPLTQSGADAILPGLDISRMRMLKVTALSDTGRSLEATISNYNDLGGAKCFE